MQIARDFRVKITCTVSPNFGCLLFDLTQVRVNAAILKVHMLLANLRSLRPGLVASLAKQGFTSTDQLVEVGLADEHRPGGQLGSSNQPVNARRKRQRQSQSPSQESKPRDASNNGDEDATPRATPSRRPLSQSALTSTDDEVLVDRVLSFPSSQKAPPAEPIVTVAIKPLVAPARLASWCGITEADAARILEHAATYHRDLANKFYGAKSEEEPSAVVQVDATTDGVSAPPRPGAATDVCCVASPWRVQSAWQWLTGDDHGRTTPPPAFIPTYSAALDALIAGRQVPDWVVAPPSLVGQATGGTGDAAASFDCDHLLSLCVKSAATQISTGMLLSQFASEVGGVPTQRVLEISGPPGVGKTQLCMQLCVTAMLPSDLGGFGPSISTLQSGQAGRPAGSHAEAMRPTCKVLYIDTEGSLSTSRITAMARAALKQLHAVAKNGAEPQLPLMSEADILANVLCLRIVTQSQLLATVHLLDSIVTVNHVKLLIIDSIAFPMRSSGSAVAHDDSSVQADAGTGLLAAAQHRSQLLYGIGQTLRRVASQHNVAVVVTNQVVASPTLGMSIGRAAPPPLAIARGMEAGGVMPALGDTWAYVPHTRLMLLYSDTASQAAGLSAGPSTSGSMLSLQHGRPRVAVVLKGFHPAGTSARLVVTADGVRDA